MAMTLDQARKKYYFSTYSEPLKPVAPLPTIRIYDTIGQDTSRDISVSSLPNGTTHLEILVSDIYGGHDVDVLFKQEKEIPNPHYEKQYAKYEKNLAEWEEVIVLYRKWKREEVAKQKSLDQKTRRKMYENLKKEFEP